MAAFPEIPEPLILEHRIAEMMQDQKRVGWPFNVRKAEELENTLLTRLEALRAQAQSLCAFIPKGE